MVISQEIIVDELFARAISNCRRYHYLNSLHIHPDLGATIAWESCLNEYTISWDFMDRFFIEDERQLSMFVLSWS